VRWHCHDCFHRMPPGACAGGIAIVIDVLRASTTMVTALAQGATAVRPVAEIAAARILAARLGPAAILGGERGGVRIDGFHFGNSPTEYTHEQVAGREVVITTTNGTAAIAACSRARHSLVGAVVNRAAVARVARMLAVRDGIHDAHLVCAGTDGEVTAEDILAAGAILDAAAIDPAAAHDELDPAARAALAAFRRLASPATDVPAALVEAFATAPGGANLIELGMQADLPVCARLDEHSVVPRLDAATGRLIEMVPATKSG